MIPVTELEMAANSTFTSILNEIQLSNLNFQINMTPFGAKIILKKTVQTDIYGNQATPSPPLLLVLHRAHQEILCLREENSKLKIAAEALKKNHDKTLQEYECLVKSFEETTESVKDATATKDILNNKINVIEKEAAKNRAEVKEYESKIKETMKKHTEEIKEVNADIKTLKNENKAKDKKIHDLTKDLKFPRAKAEKAKSEISGLKICKNKLETQVKKFGHERKKKDIRSTKSDDYKHETVDVNANHSSANNVEPVAFSNTSSNSFIFLVQWDQSSPGNSASHYSDQSMIKLNFLAA